MGGYWVVHTRKGRVRLGLALFKEVLGMGFMNGEHWGSLYINKLGWFWAMLKSVSLQLRQTLENDIFY